MRRSHALLGAGVAWFGMSLLSGTLLGQGETLYEVPPYSGLAFDLSRARLYVAAPDRQALICLNLTNGAEVVSFPLTLRPTGLAMTPDGHWLYAGETPTNEAGYPTWLPGKIAEVDLTQNVLVREIDFGFSPRGLVATDGRLLAITSPSLEDGGPVVRLLDAATSRISTMRRCAIYDLTLDPSQMSIFGYGIGSSNLPVVRAFFDPTNVSFTTSRTARDPNMLTPPAASPDGQLLISETTAYRGSTVPSEDMTLLRVLDPLRGGSDDVAFDALVRGTFVLASGRGLDFFRRDTLERFETIPVGNALRVAYYQDSVYAVLLLPDLSYGMIRVRNPALGIETNEPPVAAFTWSPPEPTTRQTVALDGRTSADDQEAWDELLYRWDFDSDGTFDTPFSTNALASYRLRTAGTHTVTLEVRDHYALTGLVQHAIAVSLETDPGQPGSLNTPWELPFVAYDVEFDPLRPSLYATDPLGQKMVLLNLTNGLIEREWQFDAFPGALAVRPDGHRLYVSQTTNNGWFPGVRWGGWVAECDPGTRTLTHDIAVTMDVVDMLATDGGYVIPHGYATSGCELHAYRVASGERTGVSSLPQLSRIALHPSQAAVYAAALESVPSTLSRFLLDLTTGSLGTGTASVNPGGGNVYPLPAGTNLITALGALLTSLPASGQDMIWVRDLGISPVVGVVPVPERGLMGLLTLGELRYLDTASWGTFLSVPVPANSPFVGASAQRIYVLSLTSSNTLITSRRIPATTLEDNLPPVVRLTSPPDRQLVTLGASVPLAAAAEDDDGVIQSVGFFSDGQLVFETTSPPYATNWVASAAGSYELVAVARDNLGATNTSQPVAIVVNSPPNVSLIDPAAAGPLLSPASFALEADATDPDGQVTRVDFLIGPSTSRLQLLGSVTASPFRLEVNGLVAIGGYVRAVAVDNHGATNASTLPLRILGLLGDDFNRPRVLSGVPVVGHANNTPALRQPSEPLLNGYAAPGTEWWTWTAPTNGIAIFTTAGSSFDTCLHVFVGTNLLGLGPVTGNDDDPAIAPASRVKWQATAGRSYRIVVGSAVEGESGDIALTADLRPLASGEAPSPPANDAFANRMELVGTNATVTGTNLGATNELSEPLHASLVRRRSVWWSWVAPASGQAEVTTAGSDFDTVLAVYRGSDTFSSLRVVEANDDAPTGGIESRVVFDATEGTSYCFAVDGFAGDTGSIVLSLALSPPVVRMIPPTNDDFTNSSPIVGDATFITAYNGGATREPDEIQHAGVGTGHSVWWHWTAAASGPVYVSARGIPPGPFRLALAVYTVTSDSTLTTVADGLPTLQAYAYPVTVTRFEAEAGRTYYLAVDSVGTTTGDIEFVLNSRLIPTTLALEFLGVEPDGQSRLAVRSSHALPVNLQVSRDLLEWAPVRTVDVSNRLEVLLPLVSGSTNGVFFRAVSLD
jgi:sugar lactone lactonase YvrE